MQSVIKDGMFLARKYILINDYLKNERRAVVRENSFNIFKSFYILEEFLGG